MKKFLTALGLLFFSSDTFASKIDVIRVRSLPAPVPIGSETRQQREFLVIDPQDDSDCDRIAGGLGSAAPHICIDIGSNWVAIPGASGSGDITDVWTDTGGGVDALTAAAGDTFDAGSADSSKPAVRSATLPGTCIEGDLYHDTDSGGSEVYVCTAVNTWVKFLISTDNIATASAAAANGSNCSAGEYARGVDTAWVAENCTSTASETVVFTNKTLDTEATGNVVTITSVVPMRPAACQNTTAFLIWDHETTNYPAAACVTGTNTQKAYADFDQTTDECIQTTYPLPSDWTGAIDATYTWMTTATAGSVAWCTQIICVADAETDDPAFPAQGAGNCVSDAAKGTTNQKNDAADTGLTATGCAALEEMHVRTCRDPNETGGVTDDLAADARLMNVTLTIRRTL